ncbi:hypothetical protein ACPOL_2125 [Acidisarcina polymorpha]|uniref:Uncharacterized protein n=1 Tax=Acidisarcina polymorpha TaxID=2211140 RepID=A0A2Z5FX25_9BACT|nr:hypothetical protein [Acidisarcina polymorpha]AXC11449.1 hypothetical protein ACPOL_2125 [Acidisarcina polymorpha]
MAKPTIAEELRKRQIAGLLILLAILVTASIFHAGLAQVFPQGWWHVW